MKYFVLCLFFNLHVVACDAQTSWQWWVNLPEDLAYSLDSTYCSYTNDEPGKIAGHANKLVHDEDRRRLTNCVYEYRGMGPHFHSCLFIYYNSDYYFFPDYIDKNVELDKVIKEFLLASSALKFTDIEGIDYLKIIVDFLYENKWVFNDSE